MTTIDPILPVRGKVIASLKADSALAALVGTRIYPSKVPADVLWPFVRLDGMTSTPYRVDGSSGGEVSGILHNFVKLDTSHPDPEASCARINAAMVRILDAIDVVELGNGQSMSVEVTLSQVIPDSAEADAYHGAVRFEALAL